MDNKFFVDDKNEFENETDTSMVSSGSDEDYLFDGIRKSSLEDENEDNNTVYNYLCQDCKTHFLTRSSEKKCVYCESSNVVDGENNEMVNIYYLPFNKTIDDSLNDYKKKIRFNFLIPFFLRKKSIYNNIKKVYLPGVIRNSKISGEIVFYAADNIKSGKKVESKKYESGYSVNYDFNNIFSSGYSKINEDNIDNINDYDYSMLSLFDNSAIADTSCIISDIDDSLMNDKINNKINKYALSSVRDSVNHDLRKLKQNSTEIQTKSEQKILYPVYLLNFKKDDKEYTYIMNAQNGKTYFKYDISILSTVIFSLVLFFIVFLIVFLIAWFL